MPVELEPGTIVTMADAAAYPGIYGEIDDINYVHHATTNEVVARYYIVLWLGKGPKPPMFQEDSGVKEVEPDNIPAWMRVTLW